MEYTSDLADFRTQKQQKSSIGFKTKQGTECLYGAETSLFFARMQAISLFSQPCQLSSLLVAQAFMMHSQKII